MKSTILFVLLFSATYAQQEETAAAQERPARAPQGHIQYSDPDGLKVSWKLYAPYTQWKSHLENPQRNQRAESGTQPAAALGPHQQSQQSEFVKPAPLAASDPAPIAEEKPVQPVQPVQPVHQVQVQYKPYSMVPTHIKQLILEMYEPQIPYVDPAVYIYRAHHQQQQEEEQQEQAQEKSQAEPQEETAQTSSQPQLGSYSSQYEQAPKYPTKYPINKSKVGYVQYKEEQPTAAASAAPQYGAVPERREAVAEEQPQEQQYDYPQQQRREADDGMPKEIHQLLNLQAMTPYHVIANRIFYKPKNIFVPKPLSEEVKGPYKYRSKIYFVKNDQETEEKEVKERTEREEPVDREEREDRVEREEPKEEVSEE
ncbi:putative mediator of RNA polymerase II transcription subunit 12 [Nasonia vitripennis]|uniref:Uncharacterized protein n=1 Tax=Nasonia vitripennis TaxID=7425 RepID=A0A7M7LMM2_NASVI|nr:putative mediator of RNA polymerase II transcription subunit 12 [Nasonia vitripennis]